MENLTAVIALAAGSLTLFAAVLKLRDEIDAKRNMALGFGAKDVLDQQRGFIF